MTTNDSENVNRPGDDSTEPAQQDRDHRDETETTTPYAALTVEDARQLTRDIRRSASNLWALVIRAYRERIWVVLGYSTWADYCAKELQGIPQARISHDERIEIVAGLREAGMSLRAIASATGHSINTVQKDLKNEVYQIDTPETVTGLDGKDQPAAKKKSARKKRPTPEPKPEPKPEPEVIDWGSLPPKVREREAVMRRVIRKEVEREYRPEMDRLVQIRVEMQLAAYLSKGRAMEREAERVLRTRDGIFTKAEYDLIRSCLHPDSRASASEEKLATAFRLFSAADRVLLKKTG